MSFIIYIIIILTIPANASIETTIVEVGDTVENEISILDCFNLSNAWMNAI